MIFNKGAKIIQWGEDSLLNKRCWQNWMSIAQRIKLDSYSIPHTKINSEMDQRPKTIKLLEENIGQKRHGIGFGNDFLDMTLKAKVATEKINWNS